MELAELLEENRRLLKENNELLKEIVSYIRDKQDINTISKQDMKNFVMDVVANITASSIMNRREFSEKILSILNSNM